VGDAAPRDAMCGRLHAVDPHGAPYALVQARIAADAGGHARARAFVSHALVWHPDDGELHRRMIGLLGQGASQGEAPAERSCSRS
jgi:hypothetical protein